MDLKTTIYSKGYSLNEFCRQAKIDRTTLFKILNGKTKMPQGYTIFQISNVLGISYDETKEIIKNGWNINWKLEIQNKWVRPSTNTWNNK